MDDTGPVVFLQGNTQTFKPLLEKLSVKIAVVVVVRRRSLVWGLAVLNKSRHEPAKQQSTALAS
jgi:hypothetical protein